MHMCLESDAYDILIKTKDTWAESEYVQNQNPSENKCHVDSIAKVIKRVLMAPL